MHFFVEAMRPDGTMLIDRIEAGDRGGAVEALRSKGCVVLRIEPHGGPRARRDWGGLPLHRAKVSARDVVLLTRQLKMLLETGAPVVGALDAAHEQTTKPVVRELLARIRERVEEGDSLSDALTPEGRHIDPVFRSMIAAGEATGTLPEVFARLSQLAHQRQQTRRMVIGALIYPLVLSLLLVGVLNVLLFFVVPRFKLLFSTLRTPLPLTTRLLLQTSDALQAGWPYLLAVVVAVVVVLVLILRCPGTRIWLDHVVVRLPLVGRLVSRLIFARVVRIWGAMLRSHVPLLETIRQSRDAVTNAAFLNLVIQLEEGVAAGGRMGQSLANTRIADPVIVSAIRTGEENGRLAEAAEFVSNWMDEDNATAIQQMTRLSEPILLALMGVVVGIIAMSLFIPLFDLAANVG